MKKASDHKGSGKKTPGKAPASGKASGKAGLPGPARERNERSRDRSERPVHSDRASRSDRTDRADRQTRPMARTDRPVPGKAVPTRDRVSQAPLFIGKGRPLFQPLFTPFDTFSRAALELLPKALDKVMPLSRAHRADLPDAVRDLSALLTHERSELGRSYWSSPRFVSAYLRYFLPWNLVRLTRLLPGLDLPALPNVEGTSADSASVTVADLGSGPLTLPLALWLSRPDWRAIPLTLVCVDTVPRPMELGRDLLKAVAELSGEPLLWQIRLVRAPLMRAFRELRQQPRLIMAGNVLNELKDKTGSNLDERMTELSLAVHRSLHPQGRALFVEPGTRLGGTLTVTLREAALEEGFAPVAPCPHSGPCPLIGQRERRWCHANQDAGGPVWLANLARDARLAKDSLSLSFMLLRPGEDDVSDETTVSSEYSGKAAVAFPTLKPGGVVGRILSDAFSVPGIGFARYACTEEGFALIPAAEAIPSGALVACRHPVPPRKDPKSGAVELLWQAE